MSQTDKKRPGRPRSTRSHQAMLQATLELLAEVGFEAISIDAIAARAKVGKTTIYRRYASKAELVADAIESVREEIIIPDTGSFQEDIDAIVQNAAKITLSPLGRQMVATIVSSASRNDQFARIYWTKYLQPRQKAFAIVLERAKARNEVSLDLDSDLVFDAMSGIMLYATIFQPTSESWTSYVGRVLKLLLTRI
ncbi:MAG: TetR/AcrR family transcriptional regulator [Cyanobacteria bacterium SBLK]|nr:TetR/AcrR family transcriptional regulator [Cyanobacteria bacterium SBLK]